MCAHTCRSQSLVIGTSGRARSAARGRIARWGFELVLPISITEPASYLGEEAFGAHKPGYTLKALAGS